MYYNPYSQNNHYFHSLEERIRLLEEENKELKEKIENLKPLHIENINYKIQELSVRELKGTLNIGMTALSDPKEIQKWLQEAEEGEEIYMEDLEQNTQDENPSDQDDPSN